jgi:hypothetical protein
MSLTTFQRARAVVLGETGVFIDRAEAQSLAAALTALERGQLIPLFWSRLSDIWQGFSARRLLCESLERSFGLPNPRFDGPSLAAGIAAVAAIAASPLGQLMVKDRPITPDMEHWLPARIRSLIFNAVVTPPEDAQPTLRGLLPLLAKKPPAIRLVAARMADDRAAAQAALDELIGLARGDMEAREWGVLATAAPLVLARIVARRCWDKVAPDDEDRDLNPVLDDVPAYPAFAASIFAEAEARLTAVATGAAPYKADGAFALDDCYAITRAVGFGLYRGESWCLDGLEELWLKAATAPDPAAKSVPSQSLTIGFANAAVAEPWPQALRAIRTVAATCRHAGLVKKLDRFKRTLQSALSTRPERMLDFDPSETLPKDLIRAYRDAVESLLADPVAVQLQAWSTRFGPGSKNGWPLAQGLIWEIADSDGTAVVQVMARKGADGAIVWEDVTGSVIHPADQAIVRLWHPIETPPDLSHLWRTRLERQGITQPFLQAGREIYAPLPAEMAGRSVGQFEGTRVNATPLYGLARVSGWYSAYPDFGMTIRGIRFRFITGFDFRPFGGHGTIGHVILEGPQSALHQVPARTLSELLRRVDLLVTVGARGP